MALRVAGYPRVSSEEQAKHGVSMDTQRNKIRLYCQLKELDLVEMVDQDEGQSAKSLERPGMRRLLELMRNRSVDGVVITKLDRLSRSLQDWSYLVSEFFEGRDCIRLFSEGEDVNTTTATGRMVLNLIMAIAQWEREVISERTGQNMKAAIAGGTRCGKIRYGFDLDPDSPKNRRGNPSKLIENAAEQAVIRMMREHRSKGESLRRIADLLEQLGIGTKEGGVWTAATINRILTRAAS